MTRKIFSSFLLTLPMFFACGQVYAENDKPRILPKVETRADVQGVKFEPFTGKVSKSKVRLRLQAGYDGPILRELNKNELVVVLGETEDFYAIQSPADTQGYVFRTYVLDNVIEGNRVNVRLKPDLEAPVIMQLKSGDHVEGTIATANPKWLEIKLPESARFYIAKEYVQKVGDKGYKERLEAKREEVNQLFHTTYVMKQDELKKPFEMMNVEGVKANYHYIIQHYPEFEDAAVRANEELALLHEAYTLKKLEYLEQQSRLSSSTFETNAKLVAELQAQKKKIGELENQLVKSKQFASQPIPALSSPSSREQFPVNMSNWLPIEEKLYLAWSEGRNVTPYDFYDAQRQASFSMSGIIEPYSRSVNNKPGDYMLINETSRLPIAFLYSTQVNLQEYVGREVTVMVSPRDNRNFAFPAYFVLGIY